MSNVLKVEADGVFTIGDRQKSDPQTHWNYLIFHKYKY